MSQVNPGPNARFVGHAAVGIAGSAIAHAAVKPKNALEALVAWLIGAAAMIWAHAKLDLPAAKVVAAIVPAIG